jgi:putative membrane protein
VIEYLPHINASLNALATVLLLLGLFFIKRRNERLHKICMLAAFGTSIVFLGCYLVYHYYVGSKKFPTEYGNAIRYTYFAILIPHVILAMTIPVLTVGTIIYGLRGDKISRLKHRIWAKVTFPIWLFVSVSGVIIYLMLYIFFPATGN